MSKALTEFFSHAANEHAKMNGFEGKDVDVIALLRLLHKCGISCVPTLYVEVFEYFTRQTERHIKEYIDVKYSL